MELLTIVLASQPRSHLHTDTEDIITNRAFRESKRNRRWHPISPGSLATLGSENLNTMTGCRHHELAGEHDS
jgi:hypothetical protein